MNVDIIVCEKRESRSFGNWIRTHKKEILTGVCLAAGTVAGILVCKKLQAGELSFPSLQLESMSSSIHEAMHTASLETSFEQRTTSLIEVSQEALVSVNGGEPFDVTKHIRNLNGGHLPSEEKIRTALENGFILGPNQTWVDTYTKNKVA